MRKSVGTVPGIYYLLFSHVSRYYDAQWSFVNGMESPLSILFFGLLLYVLVARKALIEITRRRILLVSSLMTLLILSRLDDVFLLVSLLAFLTARSAALTEVRSRIAAALVVPTVLISLYLLWNLRYSGMILPVSGLAKGGMALSDNLRHLRDAFVPITQVYYRKVHDWQGLTWRIMQVVVPLVISGIWLMQSGNWARTTPPSANEEGTYLRTILASLCIYVVVKALYNLLCVDLWSQGHWYFPVSIMITNTLIVAKANEAIETHRKAATAPLRLLAVFMLIPFTILTANSFVDHRRTANVGAAEYRFWKQRNTIWRNLSASYDGKGIVEFDDGVIAYSLPIPVLGGLGFTLDKEAFEAKQSGHLLDLAYRRGFRAFGSLNYLNSTSIPDSIDADSDELQRIVRSCFFLGGQRPAAWRFTLIYRDEMTGAVFIEFAPQHDSPTDSERPCGPGGSGTRRKSALPSDATVTLTPPPASPRIQP
jgi:hypothetical protein